MTLHGDAEYMRAAYTEALRAVGNADPNPAVGAVVVAAGGEIIARGFTHRAGFAHAERHALAQIPSADLSLATLYVTLEPCCHHGRTPPCVDAILERQLPRVVIAERDFATEVAGRSVGLLAARGVSVTEWPGETFAREAWFTTGPFFFSRRNARPRVTLKWAQTADGALAPESGSSGKISGAGAAYVTAALRSYHKFTVASPGTVRSDQPRLTIRFNEGRAEPGLGQLSPFFRQLLALQENPAHDEQKFKPAVQGQLPFDSRVWRHDFAGEMQKALAAVLAQGFNQVLLEAGPVFSELIIRHGFADALVVYRSHRKTAKALWQQEGRGNSVSRALTGGDAAPGFTLLEKCRLDDDDVLFYAAS